tara:strand:- start:97 stop:1149 length:1053 start_codon:yes stop_codon:yes gene_type:complete
MSINIDDKIGTGKKPFLIAEMSGNHNQSIENALHIVDAAADSGADAIKLQTYTADTMTLNVSGGNFDIKDKESLWSGKNLYKLYQDAYTPWEWHQEIFKRASEKGLICFSSPFDITAVEFLEKLDVPMYKIASFENNHLPLIAKAASTGKPLIISCGLASIGEIDNAVKTARSNGCKKLVLLKCTSTYPSSPKDSNISTIQSLKSIFNCDVGLSDHSLGIGVSIASIGLGASVIEKHFTLSREAGGVDSAFSMEPSEFKMLSKEINSAWESIGKIHYGPTKSEQNSLMFRRSIYVVNDIKKGEKFTTNNLSILRPGDGLSPKMYEEILDKQSPVDLKRGSPLKLTNLMGI